MPEIRTYGVALAEWLTIVGFTRIAADCYRLGRVGRCLKIGDVHEAKRIMDRLKAEAEAATRGRLL